MKKLTVVVILVLVTVLLSACTAAPAHADTTLFTDNFDDGNSDGWITVLNKQMRNPAQPCWKNSQAAHWGVHDGRLGIDIFSSPCITVITPQNLPLSANESHRFEFDWDMEVSMNMNRNVMLQWQDQSNWLGISVFGESVHFAKLVAGKEVHIPANSANYPFQINKRYHFVISRFADHRLTLEINNQKVIDTTEPAPFLSNTSAFGLAATVGEEAKSVTHFDNVVITRIDQNQPPQKQLSVPIFKQTDSQWKNEEYDTAVNWAGSEKTTIGRWGCAMTSMAMIMKYHGMHSLPNGTQVNPSTLNTWLKSQSDGYTSSGGVNWRAVTRLTTEIHNTLGTPKLEYTRFTGDIEVAKSEILSDKPVMLEILGHFLVGNGISAAGSLLITDPAYKYLDFVEHNTPLVSVRKFQPSFTDLSYITIFHSPEVKIRLKNNEGKIISAQTYTEPIYSFDEETQKTKLHHSTAITEVAKPAEGRYTLEVTRNTPGKYELEVMAYDSTAQVTQQKFEGYTDTTPQIIQLDYSKSHSSNINSLLNFSLLRHEMKVLNSLKQFKSDYLYHQLDRTAQLASQAGRTHQRRYAQTLSTYLQSFKSNISATAYQHLNQRFHTLERSL